ncbi:MAG: L,D-transpeptidase family protein [Verrucomicrobiales bacterium]|nr:L,D-transpeptidase family protein [Verrucomicrobiales bacterium]
MNSSNSKIEIDLSDQRARVYNGGTLVIETQVSTGKSGFSTPTGRYSIREKLTEKKSGRYGTWFNAGGVQLQGEDHFNPPPGASRFVGAEMPYWLRITGGIGMHIGFVPDGPASHGCIRVPSNVQPLIYSRVKVGTPVTITH